MSEYHKFVNKVKESMGKNERCSMESASASVGKIEAVSPLKISTCDCNFIYEEEEDEILITKQFKDRTKKAGDTVLVLPVDSLDLIVAVDIIE